MSRAVSVVINTYNRAESLRLTLESLSQLEYPRFEVIVVNGPSDDDTEAVMDDFAGRIKVGRCLHANLSESRNIGVALAAGDIVAFIDDDAYPDPAWLDRLVEGYDSDEVAAVGGPVWDHTGAALQARYTFGTFLGDARVGIDECNPTDLLNSPWSAEFVNTLGTNSSFRRDRLIEIGGFDEEFEYYLDENSVCCRFVDRGWVVRAIDDGFVYHKFLPSNIRGTNRAIRNRYPVFKSKCYFALKYGFGRHSFYEVCTNLLAFTERSRDDYRWCVEQGLLSEEDFKQFEADVDSAFDAAFTAYVNGVDKVRTPEWFSQHQQPFLSFPVRRTAEDKLHVCFFSQEYPPGPVHGIGRFVHTLATGLAAEGHLVRVLTRGDGHNRVDLEEGVWVHRVVVTDQPASRILAVPPRLWNYSASLLEELRRVDEHRKVDIVQGPNWDGELVAVLLAGGFNTVLSLHTPLTTVRDIEPSVSSGSPELADMLAVERFCLQRATACLANGETVVRTIEKSYDLRLSPGRLTVIHHGVPDIAAGAPKHWESGRDTVEVLFVGRMERRKGADALLAVVPELARAFPEARFVFVGDDSIPGEDGLPYRVSFERSPAGAALADRVVFTGIVDEESLRNHYAQCDVFVAPSRFESFGLVLVEAMAFGKPIVAGDNPGMRAVVEDGGNGLFASTDDPDGLREALAALLSSPERRAQFGARSRELFENRFSAERMVEATERAYRAWAATTRHSPQAGGRTTRPSAT
jgi:glycogen synthase